MREFLWRVGTVLLLTLACVALWWLVGC